MAALRTAVLPRLAIGVAVVGVTLWFAGRRLTDSLASLNGARLAEHAPALALAFVLLAVAPLFLAAAWIALIEGTDARAEKSRRKLTVAFVYAWLGRYVPGTVPFFAGKVYLGRRIGYGTRDMVVTTAVQNLLEVLVSTIIGAALVVASLGLTVGGGRYLVLAIVPAFGLVGLHPMVLRRLLTVASRALRREEPPVDVLPPVSAIAAASAMIAGNQIVVGAALWLVMNALGGFSASDIFFVTGAMSLAGVGGALVVLAPAGLGVRDGLLTGLLAARVTVETAAFGAVVFRALSVVSDVALVVCALAFDAASGGKLGLRASSPVPSRRPRGPAGLRDRAGPRDRAGIPVAAEERA